MTSLENVTFCVVAFTEPLPSTVFSIVPVVAFCVSDFGSEVSAETTEEAPETVEMEEEAGSEPEFADDASDSIGETTDEGNSEANVEPGEGDEAAEAEDVFADAADFTSEIQMEEEDTQSDGLSIRNMTIT